MDFRILGPLEVLDGDGPVALPGPRQRNLLAFLLLHVNQVVSSDRLIEELWPGEAPEQGAATLQASVSRLRKALGAGASLPRHAARPAISLRLDGDAARRAPLRAPRRGGGSGRSRRRCRAAARGTRALARTSARGSRVRAVRAGGDRASRGAAPAGGRAADRRRSRARAARAARAGARGARRRASPAARASWRS